MCKEMAERLSRLHPDVEIAVYAYDKYDLYTRVEEFYRAKDGLVAKEMVNRGLVAIMDCGYLDVIEWAESIGHGLLHPMEFAAELIRQAREGDDLCQSIAIDMLENDDAASLIGTADKKWLMELAEERRLKREEELSRLDPDDLPF